MTILDEALAKLPRGAELALLGEYGSSAHGVNTSISDYDFIGVAVEPPNVIYGLGNYEHTLLGKPDQNARTLAGADEGKVFALKKWARLAEGGNTDVMSLLFLPKYLHVSRAGELLLENRDLFISHQAILRFSGHLMTEKRRMNGDVKVKTIRPELIEQFGFDTKAAYQAVKLGYHGLRIAREQKMVIPFPDDERDFILMVRAGELSREMIDAHLESVMDILDGTEPSDNLPERPDREKINDLLEKIYKIG